MILMRQLIVPGWRADSPGTLLDGPASTSYTNWGPFVGFAEALGACHAGKLYYNGGVDIDDLPTRARRPHGTPRKAINKAMKARWMAENPTLGESSFWQLLCFIQLEVEFARQQVIAGYIVDFYHAGIRRDGKRCKPFVVEIDGASHSGEAARKYDAVRTGVLGRMGIEVIRFSNKQVVRDRAAVARAVLAQRDQGVKQ